MRSAKPALAEPTRSRILDAAERLVQTRGFNGFSYADIALEVGLTQATPHHHFATKAKLGHALIGRYTDTFAAALERISREQPDAEDQLRAYVGLYSDVLMQERMCLCGMVAAEYGTLPAPMQHAIRTFFEFNEAWLTRLLERGSAAGRLSLHVEPTEAARMLTGALEGEMLVARAYGDPLRFASAARLQIGRAHV